MPGKERLNPKAVETVIASLSQGDKSFDDLLKETRLGMATLADVLRSVTDEDVVIKGKNEEGVIFRYVDGKIV
ncbi:hypothetical protein MCGE09_00186 [Thaumarchaeota archaeon SCGC AB-539-E09]|nr:hypothetical protein MCGE09_00186 [Thaumarchaeota archaeon SCGC AB-539-E09]